jgi:hypothetical protein
MRQSELHVGLLPDDIMMRVVTGKLDQLSNEVGFAMHLPFSQSHPTV